MVTIIRAAAGTASAEGKGFVGNRAAAQRVASAALGVILLCAAVAMGASTPALAGNAAPGNGTPVEIPDLSMPRIMNGEVDAVTQMGDTIIAGGTFSSVAPPKSGRSQKKKFIVAFDRNTGAISNTFKPVVDGAVTSLVPASDGASLYIGGKFRHVNGAAHRGVALITLDKGANVAKFRPTVRNGVVNTMKLVGNQLYIGGTFTKVGKAKRRGLASLNPNNGALTSYLSVALTGHHNSDAHPKGAKAPSGATQLDVTPDGSKMIVVGNFRSADRLARDQVAMIDLGKSAVVDPKWAAPAYQLAGNYTKFDSWAEDVAFSPDGSYLVISSSGGVSLPGLVSDAAARFPTASLGTNMNPTWVAQSGMDSLDSVAITDSAIYVGGHQRFMNNANGFNVGAAGAVARAGICALDPVNGLPLAWNPGRNPRGKGAMVVLPTATGVWVGSNTPSYGPNRQYRPGRLAYFPYNGGDPVPTPRAGKLPGTVYTLTGGALVSRTEDGTTTGPDVPVTSGGDWADIKAAFMLSGTLYYSDGNNFRSAPFDGSTLGNSSVINPYSTVWDTVKTGSGDTYKGIPPNFYSELDSLTGMAYSNGRLFYTLAGQPKLFYRGFTPDSGVIGALEQSLPAPDLATSRGLFIDGSTLYYANHGTGKLQQAPLVTDITATPSLGAAKPVGDGADWSADTFFLYAN